MRVVAVDDVIAGTRIDEVLLMVSPPGMGTPLTSSVPPKIESSPSAPYRMSTPGAREQVGTHAVNAGDLEVADDGAEIPEDDVVARAAVDGVVVLAAEEPVIAALAGDRVVPAARP